LSWDIEPSGRRPREEALPATPLPTGTSTSGRHVNGTDLRHLNRQMPGNEVRALNRLYTDALKLNLERIKLMEGGPTVEDFAIIYNRLRELQVASQHLGAGCEMRTNFRATQRVLVHLANLPVAGKDIVVCLLPAARERASSHISSPLAPKRADSSTLASTCENA
jgi:hypothetical protein